MFFALAAQKELTISRVDTFVLEFRLNVSWSIYIKSRLENLILVCIGSILFPFYIKL